MGVDFSASVYLPNFDFWSRDIYVTPSASQPGAGSYWARGIYDSGGVNIGTEEEWVELADQRTTLDIREVEFSVLPQQGDIIYMPADASMKEMTLEVTSVENNGGGEVTLDVRLWEPAAP
jgi:hypothetical protein